MKKRNTSKTRTAAQLPPCQCHRCASHTATDVQRCRAEGTYSYGWLGQVYSGFASSFEAQSDQLRRLDRDLAAAEPTVADAEAAYRVAEADYVRLAQQCEATPRGTSERTSCERQRREAYARSEATFDVYLAALKRERASKPAEPRICFDCDRPLAPTDLECCPACAKIATASDVQPAALAA